MVKYIFFGKIYTILIKALRYSIFLLRAVTKGDNDAAHSSSNNCALSKTGNVRERRRERNVLEDRKIRTGTLSIRPDPE